MKQEIIKMAREAGFNEFTGGLRDDGSRDTYLDCWPEQLERFFHMAQAAERKEIAQFIESTKLGSLPDETAMHYALLLKSYATAIRARGQA